jgi:tetratricopeptide repeat protein
MVLFAAACTGQESVPAPTRERQPAAEASPLVPQPMERLLLAAPPGRMPAVLTDAYRLPPDRRFLLALGEVHHLMTGQPKSRAVAVFGDDRWHIRDGEIEVATVSAFPDFPELLAVLTEVARRLPRPPGAALEPSELAALQMEIGAQCDRLAVREILTGLRRLDGVWADGKRDPALFPLATRAAVLLALQMLDQVEMGDAVTAKALGLLAVTRGLDATAALRDEGLLAYAMGYGAHARRVAASLAETDPARDFLLNHREGLKQAALAPSATIETRYLWLLDLARSRAENELHAFSRAFFASPGLVLSGVKAAQDLDSFTTSGQLSPQVPRLVLRELSTDLGTELEGWRGRAGRLVLRALDLSFRGFKWLASRLPGVASSRPVHAISGMIAMVRGTVAGLLTPSLAFVIDRLDPALQAGGSKSAGPFLDAAVYESYYRAFFYSGLLSSGLFYLDRYSSVEAALDFAARLEATQSAGARELARWYRYLANAKAGKAAAAPLPEHFASVGRLGPPFQMRSLEELRKTLPYGATARFAAARRAFAGLDTRVDHRLFASRIAYEMLMDLNLLERLDRAAVAASPLEYLAVRLAEFVGERGRLTEMLQAPDVSPEGKATALRALEKLGEPEANLRANYRRFAGEASESWYVHTKYAGYLERIKDYQGARDVLEAWLQANEEQAPGLEPAVARTQLSKLYEIEKDYQGAWEAIAPAVETGQGGALAQAAAVLDALGRADEAERMGLDAVSRYPDSPGLRADLAGIYWKHGKYKQAAQLLRRAAPPLSGSDWQFTVMPIFVKAVGSQPPAALAAFEALMAEGSNPFDVKPLIHAAGKAGMHAEAFQMASRIQWTGMGAVEFKLIAYQYLKEAKGRDAALAWLRPQIAPQMLNRASMVIYEVGPPELLWDLIEKPEGEMADLVWVLRAAAWVRAGSAKDLSRNKLLAYYTAPGSGRYHVIGRFLLGLVDQTELFTVATDANTRCEVSFFYAMKAQAEGRYRDASDWYRVTVETAVYNYVEYRWAYQILYSWLGPYKSLSLLATEHYQ